MDQEITTKTDQIKQLDDYIRDDEYGERLLVHPEADRRELSKNIIAAKVILRCFPASSIIIREHRLEKGIKNPEYEIDGLLADRKGILSEKGIKWGFISAKRQGCKAIVIDLDDSKTNALQDIVQLLFLHVEGLIIPTTVSVLYKF